MNLAQNTLKHSLSPYLLQHAHQPVHWQMWTDEVLAAAQAKQRPIVLSIGYAACHWCHVMAHESFDDPQCAAVMNDLFIAIKVDREERPDVDGLYMQAALALTEGRGGWPLTVFLTPEGLPFYAGTYFPPRDLHGMPSFTKVLKTVAAAWQNTPGQLRQQASAVVRNVQEQMASAKPQGELPSVEAAVAALAEIFDAEHGGFGGAPKFPQAPSLKLLLLAAEGPDPHPQAEAMLRRTLDKMAAGGIYDQIGGGFARYSVDAAWKVPHFEKMLADNALLLALYWRAQRLLKAPHYAEVARRTFEAMHLELMIPERLYCTSLDADSAEGEGQYYVWTPAEVAHVTDPEAAAAVCAAYDITVEGNWERHQSIVWLPRSLETVAEELHVPLPIFEERLCRGRADLALHRQQRPLPSRDDKVLSGLNGLMLSAFAQAARNHPEGPERDRARQTAEALLAHLLTPDGILWRSWYRGQCRIPGFLEDYAFLATGLLDVYEVGGGAHLLLAAERLARRLMASFGAEAGQDKAAALQTETDARFFEVPLSANAPGRPTERPTDVAPTAPGPLFLRPAKGHDEALPSAHAVAAELLLRLSWHTGDASLAARGRAALAVYAQQARAHPTAYASLIAAGRFVREPVVQVVFAGQVGSHDLTALETALAEAMPRALVVGYVEPPDVSGGSAAAASSLTEGRLWPSRGACAYVCQNFTCKAPATTGQALQAALAAVL